MGFLMGNEKKGSGKKKDEMHQQTKEPSHGHLELTSHENTTLEPIFESSASTDFFHAFEEFAFDITKPMSFVNHCNSPWDLTNYIEITNERVVCGDENVKLEIVGSMRSILKVPLVLPHDVAPNALSIVIDAANHVRPPLKLTSPMLDGRKRNNDKERPTDLLDTEKMFDIRNDLYSLA